MKKSIMIIVVLVTLLDIGKESFGAANCPNASPEVVIAGSMYGSTYDPGSMATYFSGLANLLTVGDLDAVQSSVMEYHFKICCPDSQYGDDQKDYSKHLEKVTKSLSLGVGENFGLSTPFEGIENAAEELGIPDYWAGELADYLSGFAATAASVSYDYDASFDNITECDKCQRDETSSAFVGSESHSIGGSIGGYHPEVPGGYVINISLLDVDLSWEKSGYILGSGENIVAYESITMEGEIKSIIQLGQMEPLIISYLPEPEDPDPTQHPYFLNGNYGLF